MAQQNSGDYAEAEGNVRKALALDPSYGDAHKLLADILMHDGRPLDAAAEYVSAGNIDPSSAPVWASAAAAYGSAGQFSNAAECADKAVAADPNYEPGWVFKGNCAYAQHDVAGAKAAWVKALQLNPSDATITKCLSAISSSHGT